MQKKMKTRILSALIAASMMSSLYTPALAAEAESEVTGSVTAVVRVDYAQRLDELQRREIKLERDLLLKGLNIIYQKNVKK